MTLPNTTIPPLVPQRPAYAVPAAGFAMETAFRAAPGQEVRENG